MTRVGIISEHIGHLLGGLMVVAAFTACGGTPTQPEGPDAAMSGGLTINFDVTPKVPGAITSAVTLDSASFALKDLRVTGDAAPGDDRTHAAFIRIEWKQGHAPYAASFPLAPPGVYSNLAFRLEDDTGNAFHFEGSVVVGGTSYPFEIESETGLAISTPMSLTLPVGNSGMDTLVVKLGDVLGGIDWSQVPVVLGAYHLESGAQMDALRLRMTTAFATASASGVTN